MADKNLYTIELGEIDGIEWFLTIWKPILISDSIPDYWISHGSHKEMCQHGVGTKNTFIIFDGLKNNNCRIKVPTEIRLLAKLTFLGDTNEA